MRLADSSLAFMKNMAPDNITSAFRCTGIYPLNSLIFGDHEFIPASITDQPVLVDDTDPQDVPAPATCTDAIPSTSGTSNDTETTVQQSTLHASTSLAEARKTDTEQHPQPSTSQGTTPQPSTSLITPMQILPLPKALPKKKSNRRKVRSAILTDTPRRRVLRMNRLRELPKTYARVPNQKKSNAQKTPVPADSSSSEGLGVESLQSDSDSPDEECAETEIVEQHQVASVKVGAFVLVNYVTRKQSNRLYVGQVVTQLEENFEVKFKRKVKGSAA